VLGAWAGATLWVSVGALGVTDPARLTRVGVLPPWTWLAVAVAAGAAAGVALFRTRASAAPLALLVVPWLPWLPWRVPAAFLMWDGPLEGLVWTAAIVGVGVAAWRAHHERGATLLADPRRAPWIVAVGVAAFALVSWRSLQPRVPSGDEPHYLVIAQSLLHDGDLRIENNHRDEQYLAYFGGLLRPDFMRRGADGQIYSIHAPGTAVAVLPGFAAGGYGGAVATVVLVAALGVAAVWRAGWLLAGTAAGGWAAGLALAVASPFLLLSFTIYPDPLGSAVVAAGLLALVTLDTGGRLTPRAWAAVGAVLACLPWLHTRFAVLAGAFGLILALRAAQGGGWRDVARLLAVPAVSAAAWFGYFWAIYGVPNPSAPYGDDPGAGLAFVPTGLAGLLLDQSFGLVANAPVLAAGAAGLAGLWRTRPRLAAELAVVAVPYTLTAAAYPMWWGGFSSPARFLVVVTPVLALPCAWLWARGGAVVRGVLVAAMAVSAAATAAMASVDGGALVYNGRDGHALLLDWLSRTVNLTLAAPSVHRTGAGQAALDAGLWLAAMLVAAGVAGLAPRLRPLTAWLGAPLAVMGACSAVWSGESRPAVTPPASQARLLAVWRGDWHPTGVQLTPTRALSQGEVPGRLRLATTLRGEAPRPPAPLLQLARVPAGDYDVFLDAAEAPAGEIVVGVGRMGRVDLPLERWRLDGRRPGFGGLTLHLGADASALTVVGDDAARRAVRQVTLHPRAVDPTGRRPTALRGARYGATQVYALDDNTFLEPGALWTRGEHVARLLVRPDDGVGPTVRLTAGPIANDVRLSAGGWAQSVHLEPDGATELRLPPDALAPAVLEIATRAGFRPSAHGAKGDVRWLGAYVTWPAPPATP
jgi:hypothetical protein